MTFVTWRGSTEFPGGSLTYDGAEYGVIVPIKGQEYAHGRFEVTFEGFDLTNECKACGRFDALPRTLVGRSWGDILQRALRRGWIRPIPAAPGGS